MSAGNDAALAGVLAGLLAGTAVLVAAVPPAGTARVRAALLPPAGATVTPRRRDAPHVLTRAAVCSCAGAAMWVLLGGTAGAVLGPAGAALAWRALATAEPAARRRARRQLERDLPVCADLLAAAVEAGLPVPRAAALVADGLGGLLGEALRDLAAAVELGADPVAAWHDLAARDDGHGTDELARLARAVARALGSGAPLSQALRDVARDQRRRSAARALRTARQAGVRAVGPLALCFLPAFALLGVVPTLVGLAVPLLELP